MKTHRDVNMVLTHVVHTVQMESSGGCSNARIEPEESVVNTIAKNQNTVITNINFIL